jgi:hypothetical protein
MPGLGGHGEDLSRIYLPEAFIDGLNLQSSLAKGRRIRKLDSMDKIIPDSPDSFDLPASTFIQKAERLQHPTRGHWRRPRTLSLPCDLPNRSLERNPLSQEKANCFVDIGLHSRPCAWPVIAWSRPIRAHLLVDLVTRSVLTEQLIDNLLGERPPFCVGMQGNNVWLQQVWRCASEPTEKIEEKVDAAKSWVAYRSFEDWAGGV